VPSSHDSTCLTKDLTGWRAELTALTPADQNYLNALGNVSPDCDLAIEWALAQNTWTEGMCLQFVRSALRLAAYYPSAVAAWNANPANLRHSWYTPPKGVPVFWQGGYSGYGHVALSLGNGMIRTISVIGTTNVSTDTIGYISKADPKLIYLGWTETLNNSRVYIADKA
jgi:cell wall-associated NlpC family hydrolase